MNHETHPTGVETTTDLVKSVSVDNMVNQRAAVIARVRTALDLLAEAETIAAAAHIGFPRLVLDNSFAFRYGTAVTGFACKLPDAIEEITKHVDAAGWRYLLDESGLRSLMDATARATWNKAIGDGEFPELTLANVRSTFAALHEARGDMFERGVIACFRRLSWEYKTNLPALFGKRIIIQLKGSWGHLHHRTADELDDLMRVFHVLDGKPEADHRNGIYALVAAAESRKEAFAENDYLAMKWFKKGTGHITFKRLDLIERMNRIIAKHYPGALPRPAR